ncbi:39 kDa FK506-binding nuclear protein-like [Drosophila kikkawai]|uniref:39 kDa FK506-binding nuclear protein-like n=1 Tax=Drosophila kikkawai TaxID=30033 RepID=A0A6P4IKW6_DROKI|nr:39 kDa FK506-binding nuclear protein-like [Drosophila kikkawai]
MFKSFGLKMKPGSRYDCCTLKSLHISGVAVEKGNMAKIYLKSQKKTFILATVSQKIPQASLDLNFSGSEQITFTAKGNATVSLWGYWTGNDDSDNEEPLKVKVVKPSPKANAKKKGAKEENGVASAEEKDDDADEEGKSGKKESLDSGEENLSLIVNVDNDEENEIGEKEASDSDEEEVDPPKGKIAKLSPRTTAMKKKFKK